MFEYMLTSCKLANTHFIYGGRQSQSSWYISFETFYLQSLLKFPLVVNLALVVQDFPKNMLVGDTFVKQSQTFFTLNPVSYIFVQWQLWDRAQYICAKISLSGVAPSVMTTCVEQKGCRLSKPDDVKPKFSALCYYHHHCHCKLHLCT